MGGAYLTTCYSTRTRTASWPGAGLSRWRGHLLGGGRLPAYCWPALFGFFDALQLRLQVGTDLIPYQLFQMIPYVMTLVALTVFGSKIAGPKANGKPYYREER